jgi:chorismate-pyruvate lyase
MTGAQSPPAAPQEAPGRNPPSPGFSLAERHFVLQGRRPAHLRDIDPLEMDPYLRGLLFTDGTVTRTLEVQALSPVSVEVVGQEAAQATNGIAEALEVADGTAAIRRRVTIGLQGSASPTIWAESHIVPTRLPDGFLSVLNGTSDGIGGSLQQVKLESWRELLWFGLSSPPSWDHFPTSERCVVLLRHYRIISQAQPAMLIAESFAIEQSAGRYQLME